MQIYLSSQGSREADKNTVKFDVSEEILMKRAGLAIADEVQAVAAQKGISDVLIVCGTGNNGGDGFVAACELLKRGLGVSVYLLQGTLSAACKREMRKYNGKYSKTVSGKIILDCIFGTGLNRNLEGEYLSVVKKINASKAFVISADLPSGLNGDDGKVMGAAIKADMTIALGYPKLGYVLGDGIDYCGKVVIKDIGIVTDDKGIQAAEDSDISQFYKPRKRNTNKGDYGRACIVAGSENYLGAAVLSVSAALRSGCGYTVAVVPEQLKYNMAVAYPQCIYSDQPTSDANAMVIGMGLGCNEQTYEKVCALLSGYKGKLIIDADGLNSLAKFGKEVLKNSKAKVLITPHIGEMVRLTGKTKQEILSDPVGVAQSFAAEYNITVHLKNAVSITTDGKKTVLTTRGGAALAKAGSGDLLSGLICGNAARGLNLFDAAVCSQYILGVSAEICSEEFGDGQVVASQLIDAIPVAVKGLKK